MVLGTPAAIAVGHLQHLHKAYKVRSRACRQASARVLQMRVPYGAADRIVGGAGSSAMPPGRDSEAGFRRTSTSSSHGSGCYLSQVDNLFSTYFYFKISDST